MRCLECHTGGIPLTTDVCPTCHVYLPSLYRNILPANTTLHRGTYRIDYALAHGGFGIIYQAVHIPLNYPVAIKEFYPEERVMRDSTGKVLPFPGNRDKVRMEYQQFIQEGRILVKLRHEGIVSVRDLFEEHGTAYLVMELIDGQSLRFLLDTQPEKRLPSTQVMHIIEQLVTTLEYLHQKHVYHLDIKPENILITPERKAILTDFGAAQQGHGEYLAPQFDPLYTAPEVLMRAAIGPRSDLFELSMMTHELLTGERPPMAEERLLGRSWSVTLNDTSWHMLLSQGLQLSQEQRPESVQKWWEKRHEQRVKG